MKLGRSSIATAMYLTAIVAVDLAWIRVVDAGPRSRSVVGFEHALKNANGFIFDYGLIGMFNILALVLLRMSSSGPGRPPSLIGFVFSGLLAMLLYWAICRRWGAWLLPEPRYQHRWGVFRVGEVTNDLLRAIGMDPSAVVHLFGSNVFVTTARMAVLTLPQVIFACVGSLLMCRIRKWRLAKSG